MAVIRAEYAAQFVADLYVSTSDALTNIDPQRPKYVELDIGVLVNTFVFCKTAITEPIIYKLSSLEQL